MQNSKFILFVSIGLGLLMIVIAAVIGLSDKEPVKLPIVVQEYSDFQCPACKFYSSIHNELKSDKYKDKVVFEYNHFPLTSIHDKAYSAAVASEAAREQGKFDEYHDLLFANQPYFTEEELLSYAEELGMDIEKFETDFKDSPEVRARVDGDLAEAQKMGLNSTPSFIINGRKVTVNGLDSFYKTLDRYIERAEK